MTYIPDGASKDYKNGEDSKYFAWGWLSSDYEYNSGWESEERKQNFLEAVQNIEIVDRYRGWHTDKELGIDSKTKPYPCGSRKFEDNGTIYTAPAAVTYYIRELDYKPPEEVVKAILSFYKEE